MIAKPGFLNFCYYTYDVYINAIKRGRQEGRMKRAIMKGRCHGK
jgi:hypothetical protein